MSYLSQKDLKVRLMECGALSVSVNCKTVDSGLTAAEVDRVLSLLRHRYDVDRRRVIIEAVDVTEMQRRPQRSVKLPPRHRVQG